MKDTSTLRDVVARYAREGELYERRENGWVLCYACGHRCRIPPGRDGICKVRTNRDGVLYVPSGYVAGVAVDPIEKKPFFHAMPGSNALSFGMLGCDYHCAYCQNWLTSQALRDPVAGTPLEPVTAQKLVGWALEHSAPVITSTYNEPLITSEWAVEVFTLAKKYNLKCSYVSNGNGTPEVLEYLQPYIDFFKIDLKSFRQKNYRQLGGTLQNVLDTIQTLHSMHVWIEVVTLMVPSFNDSDEELREIATFLVSVSPDIPWHVTAFHQDYRMKDPQPTTARSLAHAARIGKEAGLRFVYAGNLPGMTEGLENTYCPSCGELLIERVGFRVLRNALANGACPTCTTILPGVWQ
jgi:pyruvate formate lyase activating enzyme